MSVRPDANARATAARAAGQASLSDADLTGIRSWYRGAVVKGIADNAGKRTQIALDGARLACRFRDQSRPSNTATGRPAPHRKHPPAGAPNASGPSRIPPSTNQADSS